MADDLAFMFSDPPPPVRGTTRERSARPQPHAAAELPAGINWMTLRQVHEETSIPVSTLRKWAKRGKVRARVVHENGRDLRLVSFGDVVERARALERAVHPSQTGVDLRGGDRIEAVVDLRDVAGGDPSPAPAPAGPVAHVSEGSILVPIDAWDRLLGQLGNLHEAGQQLAEARERAAKAETEAAFLKERLRDMRHRAEQAELTLELHRRDAELPTEDDRGPVVQIGWRRLLDRLTGR